MSHTVKSKEDFDNLSNIQKLQEAQKSLAYFNSLVSACDQLKLLAQFHIKESEKARDEFQKIEDEKTLVLDFEQKTPESNGQI